MKNICLIISLLFIYTEGKSQHVEQVTEINYYGYNGLNPSNLTEFNNKLYFFGTDDTQYVDKLMVTDGTAAGVTVVKQIDSVIQYPSLRHLTVLNNLLIFDNVHHLWKSDGTAGGTSIIANITISVSDYVVLNNTVYFAGDNTNSNPVIDQLWQTDGTSGGTKLVKTINPSGPSGIAQIFVYGGEIYFSAYDGEGSYGAPWVSDGTAAGTFKLKEIVSQYGANASYFAAYNGKVYFNAFDDATGSQLWVTDGTSAGTQKITNINPGTIGLSPSTFTVFNSQLFFMGIDRDAFYQLWSTDGTAAGTKLVKTDYTPRTYSGFSPNSMAVMNNKLYMSGYDSLTATVQLWMSDGTTAGTTKVTNFSHGFSPGRLYPFQNKLIMTGYDTLSNVIQLFASDGTAAGTVCPTPPSNGSDPFYPWEDWVPFNNSLYYKAAYGYFADYQLCRYYGSQSSVNTELTNQNILVYPNPTNSTFNIVLPVSIFSADIEVLGSTGTVIYKRTTANAVNTLDLSDQSPGMYIITVYSNNHMIASQKILKK